MDGARPFRGAGFWALALLWLPVGVVAQAAVRFGPESLAAMLVTEAASLMPLAPCGLPLAVGSRLVWGLGYRRGAWLGGIGLGALTVSASVMAGLLGPVAIAVSAVVLSLPVWIARWWLARPRIGILSRTRSAIRGGRG